MTTNIDFFNVKKSKNNFNLKFKRLTPTLLLTTLFSILFILSSSLISAAQIDFTKNSSAFSQGETLIAKVSGNFLEKITSDNIFFYRAHVRIPMVYEVSEVNDNFYIYAMLTGKTEGNYSLALENVIYMDGIQESQQNIVKNFTIGNETSSFSVSPGFAQIQNTPGSFSLDVQNLKSSQITITIGTSDKIQSQNSINVQSGEIKIVAFNIPNEENPFSENIKLTSGTTEYLIPVFVSQNATSGGQTGNETNGNQTNGGTSDGSTTTNEDSEEEFRLQPDSINVSMSTNSETKRIIYIMNIGNVEVKKINFEIPSELKPYVTISYPKSLEENVSERVEITIESGNEEKFIEEAIKVESEGARAYLNITLNFIPDYVPTESENGELILATCSQLGGKSCLSDEKCTGEVAQVKDGVCCLKPGICETAKTGSSMGKIIGWSMVAVVILFLLWFFKRYKRVGPKIDLLKIGGRKY